MIATTLFSNSHILMTLAVIILVIALVWNFTSKCRRGNRNLITGALLVAIVTTVGIGVYPVLFKKKANNSDAQKGDIEKTGGTIFICKITPMRDENGEYVAVSPSAVERTQELYSRHEGKLTVKLNDDGADKMCALSTGTQHGTDRMTMVLDGKVRSAPAIQSSIGSQLETFGVNNSAEAKNLAAALPHPLIQSLDIMKQRTVSAELALLSAEKP